MQGTRTRGMRRVARAAAVAITATVLLAGCLEADVRHLSSDAMAGRQNDTPGSVAAQDHILRYLEAWTEGIDPSATGRDAYRQRFDGGTNLLGVIPGTDLADEYVIVGAHYDGLGTGCRRATAQDTICNGATDNATGTAVVLDIARHLHYDGTRPRRSVIVAFWDREEDGLLGAQALLNAPGVPIGDIAAYVNLDIQGANLRPSGRDLTFAIGAETGGPVLTEATSAAASPSPLDTRLLSLVFGLGRSDHAVFAARGVPIGVLHRLDRALLPHGRRRGRGGRLHQAAGPVRHRPPAGRRPGLAPGPTDLRVRPAAGDLLRRRSRWPPCSTGSPPTAPPSPMPTGRPSWRRRRWSTRWWPPDPAPSTRPT